MNDGDVLITRAGQMTLLAFAVVTLLGIALVRRTFSSYAPLKSCLRLLILMGVFVGIAQYWTFDTLWSRLMFLASLPIAFCAALWLSGELNAEDKARFTRVFGSRKESKH